MIYTGMGRESFLKKKNKIQAYSLCSTILGRWIKILVISNTNMAKSKIVLFLFMPNDIWKVTI